MKLNTLGINSFLQERVHHVFFSSSTKWVYYYLCQKLETSCFNSDMYFYYYLKEFWLHYVVRGRPIMEKS